MVIRNFYLLLHVILISFCECSKVASSEEETVTEIEVSTDKKEDRRNLTYAADPFGLYDEKHNFILYVSNQSFAISTVDIKVYIDGELMVDDNFNVERQHNWKEYRFNLSEGYHELRVESEKGEATLKRKFEVNNKRWAVIDYWYYPDDGRRCHKPIKRNFSFEISSRPIGFM